LIVTVPEPEPAAPLGGTSCAPLIETANVVSDVNVAVTVVFALTEHVPVPEHPPFDQPTNTEPGAATAVRVTAVPPAKFATQVAPQAMPAGDDVTVPEPVPVGVTVTANCGAELKVAATAEFPVSVTMHVPVPVQPLPDQPTNVEPCAALAVSVTCVPVGKLRQSVPQLVPAGDEAMDPVPVPVLRMVRLTGGTKVAAASRSCWGAAALLAFPAWEARSPHSPDATTTTEFPLTVQVPGVHESKVVASPLLAVAVRLALPVIEVGGVNPTDCERRVSAAVVRPVVVPSAS
jgi:hypothetical protein